MSNCSADHLFVEPIRPEVVVDLLVQNIEPPDGMSGLGDDIFFILA